MINNELSSDLASLKVGQIDHVGIAVSSLEAAMPFYRDILGLSLGHIEVVKDQRVRVAMFQAGPNKVELLEPTDAESPIARFIEKKGEGIHHVAMRVDDINAGLAFLKDQGCRLIDETPRVGAGGMWIAFVHPKTTGGVLLELCQRPN